MRIMQINVTFKGAIKLHIGCAQGGGAGTLPREYPKYNITSFQHVNMMGKHSNQIAKIKLCI